MLLTGIWVQMLLVAAGTEQVCRQCTSWTLGQETGKGQR